MKRAMSRFDGCTWLLAAALAAVALAPRLGAAQSCDNCTVYAVDALNLRETPSADATVLASVPAGDAVWRRAAGTIDGYAPVAYGELWGWVIDAGLSAEPADAAVDAPATDGAATEAAADNSTATDPTDATRTTLAGLNLRSGPSEDDPVVATLPEGALVTLTYDGYENGYVTVDYDGATGWIYADLLGDPPSAPAS
ncbi:MAG TPA: SH3 domain-containing protein [Thermomicrobiales bacterium]|nr:SH3 domain-containing protein [Thermomicrobiales bacterium]